MLGYKVSISFWTENLPFSQICGTKAGTSYKNGVITADNNVYGSFAAPFKNDQFFHQFSYRYFCKLNIIIITVRLAGLTVWVSGLSRDPDFSGPNY